MKRVALALLLLSPAPALAGDDEQAPTPPPVRGLRPPAARPSPGGPIAPEIDEERLAAIVDAAVERAMARRAPAQAGPVGGWTPPSASPQAAVAPPPAVRQQLVPAAPRRTIGYVPAVGEERQYVRVLVPAPLHRRAMAAVGEKLVECGRPRTRLMRAAPAEVVAVAAPAPARAVWASQQSE